jgi:hypothetical protein
MTRICLRCGKAFDRPFIQWQKHEHTTHACPNCDWCFWEEVEDRAKRYADIMGSWCRNTQCPDYVAEMVWDVAYQSYLDGQELIEPDTIDKD